MPRDAEPVDAKVRQVVEELKPYYPQQIILFGSAARGEMDEYSDLDFVVIKTTDQPWLDRLKTVALLCHVPGAIDFFVYTPEEWQRMQETGSAFAEQVLRDGRIVHEAQP